MDTLDDVLTTPPAQAISLALEAAGVKRRKKQAAVVGENAVMWTRYLNRHRSPQCSKVQEWLSNAASSGHMIALQWDIDGATCQEP